MAHRNPRQSWPPTKDHKRPPGSLTVAVEQTESPNPTRGGPATMTWEGTTVKGTKED